MELKDKVTLKVTVEDIKKAENFTNCTSCILATAAARQFMTKNVLEGVDSMLVCGVNYWHRKFSEGEYMQRKENPKPFQITLTRDNRNLNR